MGHNSEIDNYIDFAIKMIKEGKEDKANALLKDLEYQYPNNKEVQSRIAEVYIYAMKYRKKDR